MGRRAILALSFAVAASAFTACDDEGSASGPVAVTNDASTTSGAVTSTGASETNTATSQQRIIAKWIDRVAGQTIAYQMDLSCFCAAAGKWSVVERDGTVLQAQYLGEGEAGGPVPQLLMTEGLPFAANATGPVEVSDSTTTLRLSADVDLGGIDDEFSYNITDFRTLPNYPTGAPTGPGTNYHLGGQLVSVGGPAGSDQQPLSGAARAVNPLDGRIIAYAATNDDRTFSLYVPEGTYRIVGLTPPYQKGEIECTLDDVTVPSPDATQLVVGCPVK